MSSTAARISSTSAASRAIARIHSAWCQPPLVSTYGPRFDARAAQARHLAHNSTAAAGTPAHPGGAGLARGRRGGACDGRRKALRRPVLGPRWRRCVRDSDEGRVAVARGREEGREWRAGRVEEGRVRVRVAEVALGQSCWQGLTRSEALSGRLRASLNMAESEVVRSQTSDVSDVRDGGRQGALHKG